MAKISKWILGDLQKGFKQSKDWKGSWLTQKNIEKELNNIILDYDCYVLMSRGYGAPHIEMNNLIQNVVLQYKPDFDFENQEDIEKNPNNYYRVLKKTDECISQQLSAFIEGPPEHFF